MCSYASTLPDHIGRLYPHVQDGDIEEHSQSQRKMFLSRRVSSGSGPIPRSSGGAMASSSSNHWLARAYERLAREPEEDEDEPAWGQKRWAVIAKKLRESDSHDPPSAERSQKALQEVRTDYSMRKLAFEPQRTTFIVEGRPVQVHVLFKKPYPESLGTLFEN